MTSNVPDLAENGACRTSRTTAAVAGGMPTVPFPLVVSYRSLNNQLPCDFTIRLEVDGFGRRRKEVRCRWSHES
ncbi:hypothetical protein HanRHA438_Chr15g0702131 [Helianthus annuus]|nr:hypothetical protein HanRHA438_Chr15g0702131 [Helianthus annuus]